MSFPAAQRIWIARALFLLGAKRSGLSFAFSPCLLAFLAKTIGPFGQLLYLLLQLFNSIGKLTDLPGLPENDLNERVWIIPKALKTLSELGVRVAMID